MSTFTTPDEAGTDLSLSGCINGARSYDPKEVNFVSICVDNQPKRVAREFQSLYFDGASIVNTFIKDREDFPNFPTQLGCQGLIVLEDNGKFATIRSSAFLDYREDAFEFVERMLEPLIAMGATARREVSSSGESSPLEKDSSALVISATRATKPIVFVENACSDVPVALDGERYCITDLRLPSVCHQCMDYEHLVIEKLMHTAIQNRDPSDVHALMTEFIEHTAHEEDLIRSSGFGSCGGNRNFSAVDSHALDHKAIARLGKSTIETVDSAGKVTKAAVGRLCRRIFEHIIT